MAEGAAATQPAPPRTRSPPAARPQPRSPPPEAPPGAGGGNKDASLLSKSSEKSLLRHQPDWKTHEPLPANRDQALPGLQCSSFGGTHPPSQESALAGGKASKQGAGWGGGGPSTAEPPAPGPVPHEGAHADRADPGSTAGRRVPTGAPAPSSARCSRLLRPPRPTQSHRPFVSGADQARTAGARDRDLPSRSPRCTATFRFANV